MDLFSLEGKKAVLLGGGGVLGAAMVKGLACAGADVASATLTLKKRGCRRFRHLSRKRTFCKSVYGRCHGHRKHQGGGSGNNQ